jgi:alpha-tubulin suppressor-like RCC1 family protein
MDPFEFLTDDAIFQIGLNQSIQYINNMCLISQRFNDIICDNDNFWKYKFIRDFNDLYIDIKIISWKQLYEGYGKIVVFGSNKYTQLGLRDAGNRDVPTLLPWSSLNRAKSISCGGYHSMIIDLNGNVWAIGRNRHGQLGLGDVKDRNIPTLLPWSHEHKAKAISCGKIFTVLLDENNNVWVFGGNEYGQLGLGDIERINVPTVLIYKDQNMQAKSVVCGNDHTVIIDLNNYIWVCGNNTYNQLGLGNNLDRSNFPVLLSWNQDEENMTIRAKSAACGLNHTVIIDMNNNVWSFGWNMEGQLGLGDNERRHIPTLLQWSIVNKVKFISCGLNFTIMIDMNDSVWVCGDNKYGQLGLGNEKNKNTPTVLIRSNQHIKAKFISCGHYHTVLLDLNNKAWTCGRNTEGQLGLGDKKNRNILTQLEELTIKSVSCGAAHTMMILYQNNYIPFHKIVSKLNAGDFIGFKILRFYLGNYTAIFYGKDGNIYSTELQYDKQKDRISPPI